MKFKVGDKVRWESQSGGYTRVKEGVVYQVVQPQTRPIPNKYPGFRTMFDGWNRDHESYLVDVAGKTERAKHRLYWPVVSKLESIR